MSVAKIATAGVSATALILVWLYFGQDSERTIGYIVDNWSTVVLAVQICVMFILAATKHYIAGGILMVTSLATLFGVVL